VGLVVGGLTLLKRLWVHIRLPQIKMLQSQFVIEKLVEFCHNDDYKVLGLNPIRIEINHIAQCTELHMIPNNQLKQI